MTDINIEEIITNIHSYYDCLHPQLVRFASNAPTEGAIRDAAGNFIESILQKIFDEINSGITNGEINSKVGRTDYLSKTVNYKGNLHHFNQIQVDRHIWYNNQRIAFIENKTYLDSCYFDRALADFRKIAQALSQHNNDPSEYKYIVFAGQNALKDETKLIYEADFWDETKHLTSNPHGIIPHVFFIFKGKRQAIKPLYKYKHELNDESLREFISLITETLNQAKSLL